MAQCRENAREEAYSVNLQRVALARLLAAAVLLLTISLSAAPCDTFDLECGTLRLGFDADSGTWVGLWCGDSRLNLLSPERHAPEVEIAAQGGPGFPGPGRRLANYRLLRPGGAWCCEVESADGPWRVTCSYEVEARSSFIRRSVSIRWDGDAPVKVVGVTLRVPGVSLGADPDNFYLLPSNFPIRPRRFAALQPGHRETEQGVWANTALGIVHSPRRRLALIGGYELQVDAARIEIEEHRGAVSLAHRFSTLARLAPGESLECGQQCLSLVTGSWDDALRGLRRFADSLNNGPPRDRPAWLDRCAIYSCYPGGSIDTGFRGAGGFARFEQRLPYLARFGFTALWLNPIHTPPPWIYSITDYRALAPDLGTKQDLKRFMERGHGLGFRVLLDLVPHGPNPDTPAARQVSAAAWTYDEEGNLVSAWGGLAADYASRAWQDYMGDIAAYWVGEFGADGYRVDCASGNAPNWKRGDGRRPSASSPLGGLELLQVVRERIRRLNPDAALFPEAWAPIFLRCGDLVYDYPFYQVMRRLATYATTEEWIRDARGWLQMERLTYPGGALNGLVRFVENHDTVRADEFFGIGPAHALAALCIFAQGTPMLYQDQEIGCGERVKCWLRLRQGYPELRTGAADYQAVRCSHPGVLAFARESETGAAIIAINFMGHQVTARLAWPRRLGARFPFACLAESGERVADRCCAASLSILAYDAAVVLLRPRPETPRRAAASARPAVESLLLAHEVARVSPDLTEHRLRLAPAKWWFVNTCEGLLLDRFVDRHTMEPITRYERLWRPLESGLWDGPGSPALGVIAADGRALILSNLKLHSLVSVRLQDDSNRGQAVEIILRARGAEQPLSIREVADGLAAVADLTEAPQSPTAPVWVDPLRVMLSNRHYCAVVSRRCGGLIADLRVREDGRLVQIPLLGSDLYTDWGLYESGLHVSAQVEPTPRLDIVRDGEAAAVTFRGLLRTPSWNGVQRGYPAQPLMHYRITYRADESPVLRVTFGLTPQTERAEVKAFFAYVLSFAGVGDWFAETEQGRLAGKPGAHPGERLFETARARLAPARPEMGIRVRECEITFRPIESSGLPRNVFFLDQGPERVALFVAMLNGGAINLPAGVERAASFEVVFGKQIGVGDPGMARRRWPRARPSVPAAGVAPERG